MDVITAPNIWEGTIDAIDDRRSVFLAGGITSCPEWQSEMIDMIMDCKYDNLTLLNPRRENFPIDDPSASEGQIIWERLHLDVASVTLFWFPKETLCPITLFELGAALYGPGRRIVIGTDLEYARREDVLIQTRLRRPDIKVVTSLSDLLSELGVQLATIRRKNLMPLS